MLSKQMQFMVVFVCIIPVLRQITKTVQFKHNLSHNWRNSENNSSFTSFARSLNLSSHGLNAIYNSSSSSISFHQTLSTATTEKKKTTIDTRKMNGSELFKSDIWKGKKPTNYWKCTEENSWNGEVFFVWNEILFIIPNGCWMAQEFHRLD